MIQGDLFAIQFDPKTTIVADDFCFDCGAKVRVIRLDTGAEMMLEEMKGGPLCILSDRAHYVSTDNRALSQGKSDIRLRKLEKDEPRYGSHFATCPKNMLWLQR